MKYEKHMEADLVQQITYFAREYDLKLATITNRLQFVRPTLFVATPRVYEKIADRLKT